MKAIILMGLPASGKTTFAKDYVKKYNNITHKIFHLEIDNFIRSYKKLSYEDVIIKLIKNNTIKNCQTIYDGLFLTNDNVSFLIEKLIENGITSIEIHYWKPDISSCLWNDKYRRKENSKITIKNSNLEKLDISKLKDKFKIKIVSILHNVERKPKWKVFADKYELYLDKYGYYYGPSWGLGGTVGNYTGYIGTVSSEPEPNFDTFDNLIEKINPNISFLKYKKLYSSCVDIINFYESDFYGGLTNNAQLRLNVKMLYNKLIEMDVKIDYDLL